MIPSNIVVVANRLPVTWTLADDGAHEASVSPGGLVSALTPVAQQLRCVWVGWQSGGSESNLRINGMKLVTVRIRPGLYQQYYQGFANQVLWPVFHGLSEVTQLSEYDANAQKWWQAYQDANLAFALQVCEVAEHGALVWVQDYHLLLVPELLRKLRPDLRISLFLHIPFPSLEHLGRWSWAAPLLRGISAAHLIGVQRAQDAAHLRSALDAFAGERGPAVRVLPISIDPSRFLEDARTALESGARGAVRERHMIGDRQMLLSVDRLDYTKGIIERIEAFQKLLESWADPESRPVLVQVLTPTRPGVPAYEAYGNRVRAAEGRVQERFATSDYTPIITISDSLTASELVDFYLATDVMWVTPLLDGMNLVAKEFVVSRIDEQGVLVLSREAGAADELVESLTVDPSDPQEMLQTLKQALLLTPEEAAVRMRALRASVLSHDVHHWAENFLEAAAELTAGPTLQEEVQDGVQEPSFLGEG